ALLVACGSKKGAKSTPDPKVVQLEKELADTKTALATEKAAADELRKAETELKGKADEAAQLQAKLAEVVGKYGEVTTADGAVRLELVDQILFPTGEADLTDNGKQVLSKVGAALKDIDKQVWVQGHTDDQPIFVRKPKPKAPEPKPVKGAKPAKGAKPVKPELPKPEAPDALLPFITNWELSAARSLTVVHYLQDEAKIDPTRLAAVAFGQYRPVSKTKSKNRRIEIVLYPKAKIAPK
ncbi:MAG: OmpA family protein, partial [Deltaproteobacteria bacterium]|nr:OmpA family protein [Deltaproteobacteria bacterium]